MRWGRRGRGRRRSRGLLRGFRLAGPFAEPLPEAGLRGCGRAGHQPIMAAQAASGRPARSRCALMRLHRSFSLARVNFQSNGAAVALYRSWKASSRAARASLSLKSAGVMTVRWMTEKTISTWLTQDAWTGRCTSVAFGQAAARRLTEAWPRWEDPLSATQNTRRAEAYGSWLITWFARAANGAIPVVGSIRPIR